MHVWGDEWDQKHGQDLGRAIGFCLKNWKRWGRIGSHGKEKYGTFRHHVYFYTGEWPIHELIKPGHVYYRWPKWCRRVERSLLCPVVRGLKLPSLFNWYQGKVYNIVLQIVCRRYPEIIDEIISDTDYPELIRPGIFGKVDGKSIRDKYWTRIGGD